jgi:hypothetical protein
VRALLALVAFAAALGVAGPLRADSAADLRGISDCAAKLDRNLPPGMEHLLPVCPDLDKLIADSGLQAQLGEHWRERLGKEGLSELAGLMQRYQASPPEAGPSHTALPAIVNALRAAPMSERSWWRRFTDWLRELLAPQTRSTSDNWLTHLLSRISSVPVTLQRLLFYLALIAVVALAGLIVWRELKLAGLGAGWRGASDRRRMAAVPVWVNGSLSMRDLDAATASDQPLILLRLLVQALAQSGRIQRERSLTPQELTQYSAFDSSDQRQQFARVSWLAEQRLYGPAQSSQVLDEQTLHAGRQLYSQLADHARLAP